MSKKNTDFKETILIDLPTKNFLRFYETNLYEYVKVPT